MIKKIDISQWLIWSYVLLETLLFSFGGGNFRIYFFISLIILVLHLPGLHSLINDSTVRAQCMFMLAMLLSVILSSSPKGALFSSLSCILYLITSWAVAFVAVKQRDPIAWYMDAVTKIVFFVVAFGLFQYLVFKTTGIALTYQGGGQLIEGQIPGFSIEANGHGKMVGFAIVMAIPAYIRAADKKARALALVLLVMSAVTLLLSMTRMALYTSIICVACMVAYYMMRRNTQPIISKIIFTIAVLIAVFVFLYSLGVIELGSYSDKKLDRLFDLSYEDVSEDYSGKTRLKVIEGSLGAWLQDVKTFFLGNGMGQAYTVDHGTVMRLAATGTIAILPSLGLFGAVWYYAMLLIPAWQAKKALRKIKSMAAGKQMQLYAEQTLFLTIYIFCMDFFSSTYVYAEMWFVAAMGILWGFYNRNQLKPRTQEATA